MKFSAKKTTYRRLIAVLCAFALFASYLLFNILKLDFFLYDYYREKTYDQVTTSSPLKANRGSIYDSNMNILAASATEWRIFVSTRDIKKAEKEDGVEYSKIIANGVASVFSLNSDNIYKKIKESNVLDLTLERTASEEEYKSILKFIDENELENLLFTEAKTTRYYPENTLAAHVLGFTGSDNQGLYGLEYYYDDLLSGDDGYYVYAKDANGNALDTEYSSYFPATDGYSLVTTIDTYIQNELESVIETVRVNHDVSNRVCGIVMNTETGAILAMATTSPFDPNNPFVLDAVSEEKLLNSGYEHGSEEYNKYKTELMQIMWSNKAVSETYEPGSTFKIVTVSAALDSGAAKVSDIFSCCGYHEVGGWRIKCHKTTGHGSGFTLAYGLQMSCNPCMMTIAERLGAEKFYEYVGKFGYLDKTGIDLPSEASTIFHKPENIGTTELATASFGQRFKVSIINQLTAIAAVANGGNLVTPYVVDKVIDSEGNIVSQHETVIKRSVISKEVAQTVSDILIAGVNGDGGAKNAGVYGYDIAAKTGTSQKFDVLDENGNSYLRIGSTVAYATDNENGIAMIIVVDEPNSSVKYGSVVAAPYISMLMEKVLPYYEYRTTADAINTTVENYVGMNVNTVTKKLSQNKIAYEVIGDGDVVLAQTPGNGESFTLPISKILLYTSLDDEDLTSVPGLIGESKLSAIKKLLNAGLNIKIVGSAVGGGDEIVIEQSLPAGEKVKKGTVITIRTVNTTFED